MKKALVLIVDDSAMVRQILRQGFEIDPNIEVVGEAADPFEARDLIVSVNPNVLTLDVEMPRMDGIQFLKKLMSQYPLPTVMVSSHTERGTRITLEALEAGAVDFIAKPSKYHGNDLSTMIADLREKVKMAAQIVFPPKSTISPPAIRQASKSSSRHDLIAIGASTGGTEALRKIAIHFPVTFPGIVVVQHMPANFTKMFAQRLNQECAVEVKEAVHGDFVQPGQMLIAPGDQQMAIKNFTDPQGKPQYRVEIRAGQKVCGHRPSVEVLFQSVARSAGNRAIGVMLTGMGADGADAMKLMRDAGARTMAQDQQTSIVFGMPKEAFNRGGAEKLVPLEKIPFEVNQILHNG